MPARIVVISGSPGTGKTTISRILAENSTHEKAVYIEVDDFWQYIRKGYIHPWEGGGGAGNQNETVIESAAASAKRFSEGGYEVFVFQHIYFSLYKLSVEKFDKLGFILYG